MRDRHGILFQARIKESTLTDARCAYGYFTGSEQTPPQ
jgi:hypothetical protein